MQPAVSQSENQDKIQQKRKRGQHSFMHWARNDQLKAFFSWLPEELHDAPGINWTELPGETMGYCVQTIGDSPDAAVLALALATSHGGLTTKSLYQRIKALSLLFRDLRATSTMAHLSDLQNAQTWYDWLANKKKSTSLRYQLKAYVSVATGYFPRYFLRLNGPEKLHMQRYALPPLPPDLLKRDFREASIKVAQQAERKANSDILTPLYPVLRQIVRLRKQLAERMLLTIREARRKVEAGETTLPYCFEHTDTFPEVNRDAKAVAEVHLVGREVTMNFTLWDKRTWVREHKERFSSKVQWEAEQQKGGYSPEQNSLFVQFNGKPSDLLWIGDLVEHRLFQHLMTKYTSDEEYQARLQMARRLGFTHGCNCSRPGLLFLQLELRGIEGQTPLVMTGLSHGLVMAAKQRPGQRVRVGTHLLPEKLPDHAKHFW